MFASADASSNVLVLVLQCSSTRARQASMQPQMELVAEHPMTTTILDIDQQEVATFEQMALPPASSWLERMLKPMAH